MSGPNALSFRLLAAANDNATNIKPEGGYLLGWLINNVAVADRFVKIYNKATAPASTDTPFVTIKIPASSDRTFVNSNGLYLPRGIGLRITNLVADADATAPTAGDLLLNIFYR